MKKILALLVFTLIYSCSNNDSCEEFPTLETNEITSFTDNSAIISGIINPPTCEDTVTSQGFVYSQTTLPKTDDFVVEKTGVNITASLNNLEQNTTYFIRTFFENPSGVYYGNQIDFKTSIGESSLTTRNTSQITKNSVTSGGNITSDGGSTITERGVCWSTTSNPTINDSKVENGSGIGSFTSLVDGLLSNTVYFIKSYSINELGVTYGNELSFKTLCDEPTGSISFDIQRENGVISFNYNYQINSSSNYNIQSIKTSFNDTSNNIYEDEIDINQLTGNSIISNLPPLTFFNNIQIEITSSECDTVYIYPDVASFQTPALYDVGDYGEGGIIIYMDPNGINGIAVSEFDAGEGNWACDTTNSPEWDGYSTLGNTIEDWEGEIGDGDISSNAITNFLENGTGNSADGYFANFCDCIESDKAVEIAENYVVQGYSSWYLPHIKTLDLIYNLYTQGIVSNFEDAIGCATSIEPLYWSSCGDGANGGFINFNTGNIGIGTFGAKLNVRPVRKF